LGKYSLSKSGILLGVVIWAITLILGIKSFGAVFGWF